MGKIKELKKIAIETRIDLIKMIYNAKAGHAGGSLSSVDVIVALHYGVMRLDSQNPGWEDRDRFVLSKGHSVEAYYTVLANMGFFPKEELFTFSQYGSRLIGHPSVAVPGVEMNTGALGHGLSSGVGMALAGEMDGKDYKVYVLMGDGEQEEGSIWEAAMAGANYKLGNLIGIVDRNRLQISGSTEDVMKLECLREKWDAFGWEVVEIDGHDMSQLLDTFRNLPVVAGKPHLVIANTIKGKGVSFMEGVAKWHHGVPSKEQMNKAMEELNVQLAEVSCG